MFPSEIEIRKMTHDHLKGGVAPSRHALSRQNYLERQNERVRANTAVSLTAAYRGAAACIATVVTVLFTRIGAFWAARERVVR